MASHRYHRTWGNPTRTKRDDRTLEELRAERMALEAANARRAEIAWGMTHTEPEQIATVNGIEEWPDCLYADRTAGIDKEIPY